MVFFKSLGSIATKERKVTAKCEACLVENNNTALLLSWREASNFKVWSLYGTMLSIFGFT